MQMRMFISSDKLAYYHEIPMEYEDRGMDRKREKGRAVSAGRLDLYFGLAIKQRTAGNQIC